MRITKYIDSIYCLMVSDKRFIPLVLNKEWAQIISQTYIIVEIDIDIYRNLKSTIDIKC